MGVGQMRVPYLICKPNVAAVDDRVVFVVLREVLVEKYETVDGLRKSRHIVFINREDLLDLDILDTHLS